jgi:hypothetical protein
MDEIKQVAKKAKEELKQLIHHSNERLVSMSKDIEANLQSIKQSDSVCERQLDQVKQRLNELETKKSYRLIQSSCSHWLRVEKVEEPIAVLPSIPSAIHPSPCHPHEVHSQPATGHCQVLLHLMRSPIVVIVDSILIKAIDPYGHFILLEHSATTHERDQDMIGWTLQRSIDASTDLLYRFPNHFVLKAKSTVKIVSARAAKTLYASETNDFLVAQSIASWGTAVKATVTRLIDACGEERDVLSQTFQ